MSKIWNKTTLKGQRRRKKTEKKNIYDKSRKLKKNLRESLRKYLTNVDKIQKLDLN